MIVLCIDFQLCMTNKPNTSTPSSFFLSCAYTICCVTIVCSAKGKGQCAIVKPYHHQPCKRKPIGVSYKFWLGYVTNLVIFGKIMKLFWSNVWASHFWIKRYSTTHFSNRGVDQFGNVSNWTVKFWNIINFVYWNFLCI